VAGAEGAARALTGLLGALYIAFDALMWQSLPAFIVAENLAYGAAYLALAWRYWGPAPLAASIVAAFNAGRLSRSVLSPTGELAPLALEHAPVLLLSLAVALANALAYYRRSGGGGPGSFNS